MIEALRTLVSRLRQNLSKGGLLIVGFAVGGLVFGLLGGRAAPVDPHAGHVMPAASASASASSATETIWTCAMHPQIQKTEPGQCPICGMDLIPVNSGGEPGGAADGRVTLSERARALAKLRTTPVRRRTEATASLRLLGRIEPNETSLKTVTAWIGGRIDRLHVKVTGERVRAGQTVATLYSPEVFAAHQDLLVSKLQVARLASSPEVSRNAAAGALDATRERLRLLGVPDDTLVQMEKQDRPTRAVAVRTPFSGTVIERMATEGAYVSTGTPLFRIADLGTLWVQLDAYESDLSRLSVGQVVAVKVEALPADQFEGKITFIDPTLDSRRRTTQVRVEVDNADGRLRPGMFAEATVTTDVTSAEASPLVIPKTAPLFTGRRALVYVAVPGGDRATYEPRTVRLGPRLGAFYPVVAGLSEGEHVVTRGAFAIDADLQIQGGPSMMTRGDDNAPGAWDAAIKLPTKERDKLAPVVERYLDVQRALAADDLPTAQSAAANLGKVARADLLDDNAAAMVWPDLAATLKRHAHHVEHAGDIEAARLGFEGLSAAVEELLRRFGNPTDAPLQHAFCSMAMGSQGASWVQQNASIDNAYFGAAMRSCGEVEHEIRPGAFLPTGKPAEASTPARPAMAGHQH